MFTYLLQSSTCLIILYGIYHFILSEMTFFKYNRVYLLLSILVSLMIPILAPLLVLSEESIPVLHWSHLAGDITYIVADNEVSVFDWKAMMVNVLWVIYMVGIIVVMLKMMYGLSKIFRYYQQGQKEDFDGYRIITTEAVHLPFSFFRGIYVSRHVPLQDHIHTILEHEEIHIRQWHTVDVLLAEMVHAFFWFNPVMIFYKRALRQAHEFLADDLICRKNSVSSYTELLLSKSQSGLELALTNQFFHSQIKKRITVMTKNKTSRSALCRYTMVLPSLIGLVVFFSSSTLKLQLEHIVSLNLDTIPTPPVPHPSPNRPKFSKEKVLPSSVPPAPQHSKKSKLSTFAVFEPQTPQDAPRKDLNNQNVNNAQDEKNKETNTSQAVPIDPSLKVLDALFKHETLDKPLFLIDGVETNASFLNNKTFKARSVSVHSPQSAMEKYGEKAKFGCVELIEPIFTPKD